MVTGPELVRAVDVANELGEGVLWNEERRSVWWTDIEHSTLFEYDLVADTLETWTTPHRVACFGFVDGSDDLIVAFDSGIGLYSLRSGSVEWFVGPGALPTGIRFNDGKIDPAGRFWVGTMVEDPGLPSTRGALYCLDPEAGLVEHVENVTISNGLCWSPGGDVMYHADSPKHTICAYRFDRASGAVSGGRVFAMTAKGVHPDGSTVDSDGGLWNAQWGGGQVVRYSEDGDQSLIIDLPMCQPTCVAFGGDNLDLLFVTSARAGLSEERLADEPMSGSLFIYQTNFTGLPACRFQK